MSSTDITREKQEAWLVSRKSQTQVAKDPIDLHAKLVQIACIKMNDNGYCILPRC